MFAYLENNIVKFVSKERKPEVLSGFLDGEEIEVANEEILGLTEIEYTGNFEKPFFNGEEIIEDPGVTHTRKYQEILSAEVIEDVALEGELFTDAEIGDIITHRVFGGNPHAERATTNKVLKILASLILGFAATGTMPQMTEEQGMKIATALDQGAQVDAIRTFFKLGSL